MHEQMTRVLPKPISTEPVACGAIFGVMVSARNSSGCRRSWRSSASGINDAGMVKVDMVGGWYGGTGTNPNGIGGKTCQRSNGTIRHLAMQLPSAATVRVPATTSNLGPGYDCLGIALQIYNEVTVRRLARRARLKHHPL